MTTGRGEPDRLELRLDAVPASVRQARTAVADFARQVGAPANEVELAVAEATANSVLHGFRGRKPGTVGISAERDAETLTIVVADNGDGIRPNPTGNGLGLGLALIGQMAASFNVARPPAGGTEITMVFPIRGTG
jgi:anti-sigma regulatory factor (Ser/Thr protein kinase)